MLEFVASKYYSEKKGLQYLRYAVTVHIGDEGGYVTYTSANGRKCRMKFFENENGYCWTSIAFKDKTKMSCRINRLVYSNLVGEIPKGYQIDHIDRNRKNNYPENLRLVTPSENNKNRKDMSGENNGWATLTAEKAREICRLAVSHELPRKEIARRFNVSEATVKSIRAGRNWKSFTEDLRNSHTSKEV